MSIAKWCLIVVALAGLLLLSGCGQGSQTSEKSSEPSPSPADASESDGAAEAEAEDSAAEEDEQTIALFNGRNLDGWKKVVFGGDGEIAVRDGALHLGMGATLTGVTYTETDQLPRENYEITLQAKRVQGTDFFCGLTFPVGEDHVSLILGGWGGTTCGISSINFYDASENESTTFQSFEKGQWYDVRIRVTPTKIECWLDGEQIVDVEREGKDFDVRMEVEPNKPLGIATYATHGAIRDLKLRKLD